MAMPYDRNRLTARGNPASEEQPASMRDPPRNGFDTLISPSRTTRINSGGINSQTIPTPSVTLMMTPSQRHEFPRLRGAQVSSRCDRAARAPASFDTT